MQTFNTSYTTLEELEIFLHTIKYKKEDSILVQIFSGMLEHTSLEEVIAHIKYTMRSAIIIGSSTAGEILNGKIFDKTIVISVSVFTSTQLIAKSYSNEDSLVIGQKITQDIVTDTTKAIILFADGLQCNGEAILQGMNQNSKKGIIVSGGMAGDNSLFLKTFVIHDENIFEKGAVAVSLSSTSLQVHNSYNLSWKSIGLPMMITKADKNRIYEIDNKPIIDIYREYLGEDVVQNLPDSAIEFPLIFQRANLEIARSMVAADESSITYAGEIARGTKVRFGVASATLFDQGSKKLYEINKNVPIESLFIYSCVGRKMFLGKELEHELEPLTNLAPISGFFTYGELYSGDKEYQMLNITTTVLGLSESDTIKNNRKNLVESTNRVSLSTTALIHLAEKSIANLEKESQEKQNTIVILDQYQKAINASYIISKADLQGKITFANKRFCEVSGYTQEELLGKSHSILRHPNMPSETFEDLWQTIKSKQIWRGVVQNLHKNGTSYYVDATIFPLLDKDENITGYVGMRNDITDIKYQKERAEAILNAQDSIVLLTSLVNNIMQLKQLNQKFFDTFDYKDMDDFLSQHSCICDLFLEQEGYLSREVDAKSWLEILLEDQTKAHLVLVVNKEKQQRVFSVKAKEICLEAESVIISTFTDVTELETARVQALAAEQAKGAFLATMSHELRTPLNAVIGFSQILIKKENMADAAIKSFIEKINLSGKHLLNLVNNILDFSKIDSGKIDLHEQNFTLNTLFNESFLLLESQAQIKEIKIRKSNYEGQMIFADAQLIKQVVVNILSNAIKFSPEKSEIVMSYTNTGNEHHIKICDQGVGLNSEQISKLFQSFSQVREHQNEAIKGTGLGLAISKKIVELHQGSIDVQSTIGIGSCFTITLPIKGKK
ncbi:MAG: PAS domain S-box protein [Sulfurospirillum sp.]|nr:PAS domain S-box protein [Sulfurospirillum sp.]